MRSDTGKLDTKEEVLKNENDMKLYRFLPSETRMTFRLRHRRAHLSGKIGEGRH